MDSQRSFVVTGIIVLNIAVFAMWVLDWPSSSFMEENFLVSWDALVEGRWWVLLTSVFSHSMLLHLFVNMFVLNSFGRVLEIFLGHRMFLKFYLIAGVIGSLAHVAVSNWLIGNPGLSALGASGAVCGAVLLFSLIFPREKILIFGLIPVPAIVGALAFVGLDLWGLSAQTKGGGLPIGHGAHLGGAFAGFVYYLFVVRPRLRRGADSV